ncbi:hypothetical protein B0T24DRAFT_626806 [Lasiosphaeria ovina]|uniref:Secreted protein n=1 Tax=Lasiosphaeria ovina TaxID=92902 RepID=A0AAE0KCX4_9PEZI|nr:hypothetical protein B0T24DRAFT_626806 [Lasiosphaeria ovina]
MHRWFPFLGHVLAFNSTAISTRTALDLRLPEVQRPIPGLGRSADPWRRATRWRLRFAAETGRVVAVQPRRPISMQLAILSRQTDDGMDSGVNACG